MDYTRYDSIPVQMAVDLVNTFSRTSGEDQLTSPHALRLYLDKYETNWASQDWCCDDPTNADLAAVLELRSKLRAVFDAEDEHAAAEILNELLAGASAMPRISMHNASPHMHFEPASGRLVQWLGATTAMGLGVVLCEHGLARFGLCHADSCEDAFVDTSKNRSRRNCSSSCTTRENVAAHRRRRAASAREPEVS